MNQQTSETKVVDPPAAPATKPAAKKAAKKKASKKKGARTPRTARPELAEGIEHATGKELQKINPLHVQADHKGNQRWSPYNTTTVVFDLNENARTLHEAAVLADPKTPDFVEVNPSDLIKVIGPKCCFTAVEIERRIASFKVEGQMEPVIMHVSTTKIPQLEVGFLRHIAACVLTLRGTLAACPGFKARKCTGLDAIIVTRPMGQTDYSKAARRNFAENSERKAHTAIDIARYIVQQLDAFDDKGNGRTVADVAKEVGLAPTSLSRYIQLFNDTPQDRMLAVHEGRMTMGAALAANKDEGRGNTRGTQPAMKIAKIRNAFTRIEDRPAPSVPLAPNDIQQLLRAVTGEKIALSAGAQEWAAWMQAEKAPKPPKSGKKAKAAPTNGHTDTAPVKGDS